MCFGRARQHGNWCPGYQREAHPVSDLTVDHVVPLAAGGAPLDIANCAVLCRSCNSTKGAPEPDRGYHTKVRPLLKTAPAICTRPAEFREKSRWSPKRTATTFAHGRVAAGPTAAWRNRITGTGEEAPDQLLANPANWRLHPRNQQTALAGALDTVGWVQQVMVNQRTGFVVDGHARVALAISRNGPTVPVLYVDLSPEDEAVVLATLDPIGAMATTDEAKLNDLLAEVAVDDAALRRAM